MIVQQREWEEYIYIYMIGLSNSKHMHESRLSYTSTSFAQCKRQTCVESVSQLAFYPITKQLQFKYQVRQKCLAPTIEHFLISSVLSTSYTIADTTVKQNARGLCKSNLINQGISCVSISSLTACVIGEKKKTFKIILREMQNQLTNVNI